MSGVLDFLHYHFIEPHHSILVLLDNPIEGIVRVDIRIDPKLKQIDLLGLAHWRYSRTSFDLSCGLERTHKLDLAHQLFLLLVTLQALIGFDLLDQHARVASLLRFYLIANQPQLSGKRIKQQVVH